MTLFIIFFQIFMLISEYTNWERKEWLLKLAIPEHYIMWTFLVCPIAGLITAGIGMLIG